MYVISDVHGMIYELKNIFSRILPLRKSDGGKDSLVMLGDYIDRRIGSYQVIDLLIKTKNDFPDQTTFLMGNHEYMFLSVLEEDCLPSQYVLWMSNGGDKTIEGYMKAAKLQIDNPYLIKRQNLRDLIPQEHIDFYKSLLPYYETEKFIFVHGGCDPYSSLKDQDIYTLLWDRTVYQVAKTMQKMAWDKTIVAGHNSELSGKLFFGEKFWMIDSSLAKKVNVFEMTSRTGFSATVGNKRLVKEQYV